MTEVNFYTNKKGELLGFHCHGHSGYADEGEDIVCAAISSAVYLVINTITDVLHIDAEIEVDSGDSVLRISSKNAAVCRDILQGLKLHMLNLEEQYNKFIIVKYTEV
jgi:hypothetical protein